MKTLTAAVLGLVLALSLSACGEVTSKERARETAKRPRRPLLRSDRQAARVNRGRACATTMTRTHIEIEVTF